MIHARTLQPELKACLLLGLASVLSSACSHTTNINDTSPELLAQSRAFSEKCSLCHALPSPKRHNYDEWQLLLGIMQQRMLERGMEPLSEKDTTDILAYLKHNAR